MPRPAPGESPEAKAREARYGALRADQLKPGEVLLTAHHADDQLETVLIQLLRGAGPAGLASHASAWDRASGPGRHMRPLLAFERAALEDWLADPGR
jgi:tRNA(Ile)-lysidine synthase